VDAEFMSLRTIVVEGTLYAAVGAVDTTLDALKSNFKPSRTVKPFYFKHPGITQRVVYGKPLGARYNVDQLRRLGTSPIQIQIQAGDPRQYGTESTDIKGLASVIGGMTFPLTFPQAFNESTTTVVDALVAANGGNIATPAVLTITGPVTNPAVEHVEQGKSLAFSIALSADQTLVIDLLHRTVLLNGTTNRRNTMLNTSQWFLLQPGTNSLRYTGIGASSSGGGGTAWTTGEAWVGSAPWTGGGGGGTVGTTLTATWRPAWL
jgi:hypothetical protein